MRKLMEKLIETANRYNNCTDFNNDYLFFKRAHFSPQGQVSKWNF